jgi:hypothetical protein
MALREIGFKDVNCFELTQYGVSRLIVIKGVEYLGSKAEELSAFSH